MTSALCMVDNRWATTIVVLSFITLSNASCINLSDSLSNAEVASSNIKESEMSFLGGIIPEPEEPLERVVPGAFSESERRHHLAERLIKTRMLLLVHLHLSRLIIKVPIYKKGNMKIVAAVWIRSPESRSNIFLKSYWILLCKTK